MSVTPIHNKVDFDEKVKAAGTKLVIVDFHAQWCGPCKQIAPKLDALAASLTDVVFLKVDVDEVDDLTSEYKITSMPTFIFIKNGQQIFKFVGSDAAVLEKHINERRA